MIDPSKIIVILRTNHINCIKMVVITRIYNVIIINIVIECNEKWLS